jgi:hypothetical protein
MTYKVGYRKPPLHSRFSKGRSGNPSGRPKGRKTGGSDLKKALEEFVTIQEGGKKRKVRMSELIAKRLANAAARGDWKAINKAIDFLRSEDERTAFENSDKALHKVIVELVSPDGNKRILE